MKDFFADFTKPNSTHSYAKWAFCAFVCVVVLLLTFDAGISIGERHAYDRASHFGKNMPPPPAGQQGDFGFLPHGFVPEEHGAVGTVTAVTLPQLTLMTRSGETEIILVSTSTLVRNGSQTLSPSTLAPGQTVVIIGEPDASTDQIEARLIRILP